MPTVTTLGDNTRGNFAKKPTKVTISSGTVIQSADGNTIDPSSIGIYESDTATRTKANAYHTKNLKNKGSIRK